VLRPVDVQQHLALEDVERLVLVGMQVQRRRLTALGLLLEEQERATRLLARGLDGQEVAVEPEGLALVGIQDDRDGTAHGALLPERSEAGDPP
jgi:hypothetical protein